MTHSTTETYQMKREILNFSKKITKGCGQVAKKFATDMVYGIAASESIILSNIADPLMEDTKKINVVDRLSRNLSEGLPKEIEENYLREMVKLLPPDPVIFVDDSDVTKPHGKKFEGLCLVRDGSETNEKARYKKGYHVAEVTAMTASSRQPVSLFSRIYSSKTDDFISANEVTKQSLEQVIGLTGTESTFVFDRGYDSNDTFLFMYKHERQFIIRLTENRKLLFKGKWYPAPVLRDSRKGKIKSEVWFDSESKECWISCVNVRITASRKPLKLVLVYGLGETPMMLATNKPIKSKEDAVNIVRAYLSRWRIEEYFRAKKQQYGFENFRVRSLISINTLNQFLTYCLGFLGVLAEKPDWNTLKQAIFKKANAIKEKVLFFYYRISKGVSGLLAHANTGIRDWLRRPPREKYPQLRMKLPA